MRTGPGNTTGATLTWLQSDFRQTEEALSSSLRV